MRPGVTGHKGRKGKQEQFPAANGLESSTGVGGPEHFLHCSAGHSVTCLARFRSQTSNRRVFFLSSSTLCCARILFGKLFSLVVLPQASEKDVSQFQPPPVPGDSGKKKPVSIWGLEKDESGVCPLQWGGTGFPLIPAVHMEPP